MTEKAGRTVHQYFKRIRVLNLDKIIIIMMLIFFIYQLRLD